MRVLLFLASSVSALSFASTGEPLLVHHLSSKLASPFTLSPAKGEFVASIECRNSRGLTLFYAETGSNACGTQISGSTKDINYWISQLTAKSETADATAELIYSVASARTGRSISTAQKFFAPRVLRMIDTRPSLVFGEKYIQMEVALLDQAYVTAESTFTIRPYSNWPENISAFTNGLSISLYVTEEFKVEAPKTLTFAVVDKKTGLVSEEIIIKTEFSEILLNQNVVKPLLITLGFTFLFFIGLIVFFVIPEDIAAHAKKPEEEMKVTVEVQTKKEELKESINQWNKRILEQVEAEKHNLSMTRASINDSEIQDVAFTRISALDLSRMGPELNFENDI